MSDSRPLRVAIVGSGPAGMYAAGHLLGNPGGTYVDGILMRLTDAAVEVDVFERLPTPWGLVRGGVAPDHPEKKLVARVFERIAARPGFRFFGNVEVGRDLQPAELAEWYDAVIYAVGASADPHLDIPGEDLAGCVSARQFVGWYNGHPDLADLRVDLTCERAVIVGNGNVALDVARILALHPNELAGTDIADHALEALRGSAIREVVILGRRDHCSAAFANPELDELAKLTDVDVAVDPPAIPTQAEARAAGADWNTRRKLETLRRFAARPAKAGSRRIVLRFLSAPVEFVGDTSVEGVLVCRNRLEPGSDGRMRAVPTDETSCITAGLVVRAVGYHGAPIPGIPFDKWRGVIPHEAGRVVDTGGVAPGSYVTGWIKRGPSGIIGTNKKCARDTVRSLLDDASSDRLPTRGTRNAEDVAALVRARRPTIVTYQDWKIIDRLERRNGRLAERPRVKLTRRSDLLAEGAKSREGANKITVTAES